LGLGLRESGTCKELEEFCGFGGVVALVKVGKKIAIAKTIQVEFTHQKIKLIFVMGMGNGEWGMGSGEWGVEDARTQGRGE
jgi:hypothetical protein